MLSENFFPILTLIILTFLLLWNHTSMRAAGPKPLSANTLRAHRRSKYSLILCILACSMSAATTVNVSIYFTLQLSVCSFILLRQMQLAQEEDSPWLRPRWRLPIKLGIFAATIGLAYLFQTTPLLYLITGIVVFHCQQKRMLRLFTELRENLEVIRGELLTKKAQRYNEETLAFLSSAEEPLRRVS